MANVARLPGPGADRWDWQLRAACRGMGSSFFFHSWNERGPDREEREEHAKAVCAGCPVIAQCRAHALSVQEAYGVWGGPTEEERLAIAEPSTGPRAGPAPAGGSRARTLPGCVAAPPQDPWSPPNIGRPAPTGRRLLDHRRWP